MKSSTVNRQALVKRAGKMSQRFRSGRLDAAGWRSSLRWEADKFEDQDWKETVDKCLSVAENQISFFGDGTEAKAL
jgi:hypothetical protein